MDVQTLKQQHDITQIIGRTVQLKKQGNRFVGLCPLHKEDRPSLTVYPAKQAFHCFGCGAHGDVIEWLMLSIGIDFKTALSLLGNLPECGSQPLFKAQPKRFKSISQEAAQYWHDKLGKKRIYFHNRGFADNTIDRELWGWDGRRFVVTIWEGKPQASRLLAVKLRRDDEGEVRRLQENGLEEETLQNALKLIPKYILRGSYNPLLYCYWRVKDEETIFVFFGELDCALAIQFGLPACSPVHGANSWQKDWGSKYLRYAKEMIIIPDRGEREQGFIARSLIGGHAKVFKWPDGDFDDFTDFLLSGHTMHDFVELYREQGLTDFSVV